MANDPAGQEQVRSELASAASALLMGPLRPDEVIASAPVDTYLTGILWPRGAPVDGIDDDAGLDSGSDPASGVETAVPGYRAIRPCSIGITFAALLLSTFGVQWARSPSLLPALLVGIATVIAPLFLLQPALGAGIASSNPPRPLFNALKSVGTHVVYGCGLYLAALVTSTVIPRADGGTP